MLRTQIPEKLPTVDEVRALLWADQQERARALATRLVAERPEDPDVRKLAEEVDAWTEHLRSPEAYAAFYQSHRPPAAYVPAQAVPEHHRAIARLDLVRTWMGTMPPKRILDLGCFDGWALLNLCHGFKCSGIGVDLDTDALKHAAASASTLGLDAQFVPLAIEDLDLGQKFDTILLMEILEHVRNPQAVIAVAERHLAPGGRIYIDVPATPVPHDGNAHEAREHLRVFDSKTLLATIGDRAVDEYAILDAGRHQEQVLCYRRPKTIFVTNPVAGGWTPENSKTYGGSEEMVIGLADSLQRSGHEVTVYFTPSRSGILDMVMPSGVRYVPLDAWDVSTPSDLAIIVKFPEALDRPFMARATWLWTADPMNVLQLPEPRMKKLSGIVAISSWHRQELAQAGLPEDKLLAFPLGVPSDLLQRPTNADRDPHAIVYASSFDRGLERLLASWGAVKAAVPDASLHIWYGWDLFDRLTIGNPAAASWKVAMDAKMAQPGVVVHPRTDGEDMTMYQTAGVWAYPCIGGERFCLTAIKAQKFGAIPVVTPVMALHETVRHGIKCEQSDFAEQLIFALSDLEWQKKVRAGMQEDPAVCLTWEEIACRYWRPTWAAALHTPWRPVVRPKFRTKRQTLSVCLITRNSEAMLIRTLRSIKGLADEIIFADQGSTDRTLEIAKEYGAKIVEARSPHYCLACEKDMPSAHYEETDHEPFGFEGPRNVSIAPATCDWIAWIDTDEELVRPQNLEKYLRRNTFIGYGIKQHHFSIQPPNAFKPDLPVRVFRNGKGIRFFGKIHEHPEAKMNDGIMPATVLSDVDIAHDGYFVEEGRRTKFRRNIGLMQADRRFYPDRTLGKFLWLRDLLHLCRYDLESSGGALTPPVVSKCEEAVRLFETEFLGVNNLYAQEGLDYYSEALRILNRGFDVVWALGAAPHNAQPTEPRRARFSTTAAWQKHLAGSIENAVAPFQGKYV